MNKNHVNMKAKLRGKWALTSFPRKKPGEYISP
jgi:hypothetical protein